MHLVSSMPLLSRSDTGGEKKPWIDRKLISLIRRKDRLCQMACRSPLNSPVHAEYKRIREEFSKKLKRRRRDFVKGKMEATGNDQKKLWKALAEITGYKELDREDITEISAQSLADMLKAHMSSPQPPMESGAHPAPETTTGLSFEIRKNQWKPWRLLCRTLIPTR